MKIAAAEIYAFDIPLHEPFKISIGTMFGANDVLVRLVTDSGLVGWGEACPFPPITGETQETNLAVARNLREMIVGHDPFAVQGFLAKAGSFVRTNPSIVAAFDMAMHDLQAQAVSLPLFRFLGGEHAAIETDITADLDTPEKMAEKARRFLEAGYRKLKVKVGQDPVLDIARLEAIRSAVGDDCSLSIDANQGWTVPQAVLALKRMEKFGIAFVEQPVAWWDIPGLAEVRRRSPIPVMADEALFTPQDAVRLIRAEACDYFNIKLMKSGGILNALRIAHIAAGAGIQCLVGCMLETRLALTAAAHLMASQPNIVFADLDGHTMHTIDPIRGGMIVEGGRITLPEKPGLGLEIEPDFLAGLRRL